MSQVTLQDSTPLTGRRRQVGTRAERDVRDDEIRAAMLAAGRTQVLDRGLTVSVGHLSYEDVIQSAGVSRSAAYRLWRYKEDFYEQLLAEVAGSTQPNQAAFDSQTLSTALQVVAENRDALSTAAGRRAVFLETARVGSYRNFEALHSSKDWRTYVALGATVLSLPDGETRREIVRGLRRSEIGFLDQMAEFYDSLMEILGFRLRNLEGLTTHLLALAGAAVIEGLAIAQISVPELSSAQILAPDPLGSSETSWPLASYAFTATVESFIEEDPEFDTEAGLAALDRVLG